MQPADAYRHDALRQRQPHLPALQAPLDRRRRPLWLPRGARAATTRTTSSASTSAWCTRRSTEGPADVLSIVCRHRGRDARDGIHGARASGFAVDGGPLSQARAAPGADGARAAGEGRADPAARTTARHARHERAQEEAGASGGAAAGGGAGPGRGRAAARDEGARHGKAGSAAGARARRRRGDHLHGAAAWIGRPRGHRDLSTGSRLPTVGFLIGRGELRHLHLRPVPRAEGARQRRTSTASGRRSTSTSARTSSSTR